MPQKSRVRTHSSESVVGLKNRDLFAKHGVKGAVLPCGAWGGTPLHKPDRVNPTLYRTYAVDKNPVFSGGLGVWVHHRKSRPRSQRARRVLLCLAGRGRRAKKASCGCLWGYRIRPCRGVRRRFLRRGVWERARCTFRCPRWEGERHCVFACLRLEMAGVSSFRCLPWKKTGACIFRYLRSEGARRCVFRWLWWKRTSACIFAYLRRWRRMGWGCFAKKRNPCA